ncbi:L-serine ammonia-lyase [Panus rudis PR-1116 ss-1]|nr:L-serine ammonia-lyase [Panus rudis PR-1116 ss-1]
MRLASRSLLNLNSTKNTRLLSSSSTRCLHSILQVTPTRPNIPHNSLLTPQTHIRRISSTRILLSNSTFTSDKTNDETNPDEHGKNDKEEKDLTDPEDPTVEKLDSEVLLAGSNLGKAKDEIEEETKRYQDQHEHAVISAFDLFSIGVGPSSSHTVGPMRAGKIFINDLQELGLLDKVKTVKITLYGSLAATGKGHHTPQAILLGLEGSDPETIDTGTIPSRYQGILDTKQLTLGGKHTIHYDMDRDMLWRWDQVLKTHPNGMRFSVFGEEGDLLATNEYFSVGGGFVVNDKTKVDENLFYKGVNKNLVHGARLHQSQHVDPHSTSPPPPADPASPPYPFSSGDSLLALTKKHNMTIAQIVYDNERHFGLDDDEIHQKLMRIWAVMDDCIRQGVSSAEEKLPGRLGLRRRAPMLYRRLMRGFYPGLVSPNLPSIGPGGQPEAIEGPKNDDSDNGVGNNGFDSQGSSGRRRGPPATRARRVIGSFDHPVLPMPPRKTMIPAMDFLSCYAIAVNEVNASGGRIVTSPTNGAAGVIPAVLKYIIEFITDDPEKAIETFLLTAAAVGMLFKRGSTISAAEGGCQAEVGVACSMASAGFAACMGASPETVLQAAEIGIEHNLGLTCDPIDGLVQVPCIERNSLGAVKAVTAAQLSMASQNVYSVSLDEAIEAMRLTAADMSVKYKETSLSGLARTVKIPLTMPNW